MGMPVTKTVEELEILANKLEEAYRQDLEHDLGEDFSVDHLGHYNFYPSAEDYFYKLEHRGRYVGIIMPMRKKAFCRKRHVDDPTFKIVSEVLERRGYSVTYAANDPWNLVELGRRED